MEQLQEMFGPLVEEQLGAMDWAPVKREAEQETAPANRKRREQNRAREALAHRFTPANHPGAELGARGAMQKATNRRR